MYTFNPPPQRCNRVKAKLAFYSEQTDELLQTRHDLILAYQVASEYDIVDARYYQDMYNWMNSKYGYVMDYALSFIPSMYEKH